MSKKTTNSNLITRKRIKVGEKYHMLSFDGQTHRMFYGTLSCTSKNHSYAFSGKGVYKVFSEADVKKAKTGQPLRAEIANGRLSFVALFVSKKEAISSIDSLPRSVAIRLIKKTIDADRKVVDELRQSMVVRINMINDVITSKNLTEMAASIKKSANEKKNRFLF